MLKTGPARKLIVYVGEKEQWQGTPTWEAVLHFLHRRGCAGATVTRAVGGFGASGEYHTGHLFALGDDLAMRIEMIESEQKITALLPWIYEMVSSGVIEVQETEVVKHSIPESQPQEQAEMKHDKLTGQAKLLLIHIGEDDKWEGELLHEAIVRKLRMMDIAGATVHRGILGYGAQQRLHRSGFLGLSRDLPIVISVVDAEEKIRKVLPVLDEMVDEGLIVLSDVEIIRYTRTSGSQIGDAAGSERTNSEPSRH